MIHDLIPCFSRSNASDRMDNLITLASFFHPVRIGFFSPFPFIYPFHGPSRTHINGDEVHESIDALAQPIFSKTPYNTLALTVLSLRRLDIYQCGIRLILSKEEQLILYSPRYPFVRLRTSWVQWSIFVFYIPSIIAFWHDLIS